MLGLTRYMLERLQRRAHKFTMNKVDTLKYSKRIQREFFREEERAFGESEAYNALISLHLEAKVQYHTRRHELAKEHLKKELGYGI